MRETEIRLRCDQCGETSDWFDGAIFTLSMFMKELRDLGWVRGRGGRTVAAGDRCPRCSGNAGKGQA